MFGWRVALASVDILTASVRVWKLGEIIRIEAHRVTHFCRIIYGYIWYEINSRSSAYSVQRRDKGGYLSSTASLCIILSMTTIYL